jgi:glutamate-1-semialdehyde 2,1-aminomutase
MSFVTAIVQTRYGSSRLPGKVMKSLGNNKNSQKNVIELVNERLKKCKNLNKIIFATTTNCEDDIIANFCSKNDILFYRGNENNVLERFYQTALISSSKTIVRITCDCPLIDPNIVDEMISNYIELKLEHYQMEYYNGNQAFPDGFDCEIFSFNALKDAFINAKSEEDLEHVTPYISKKYNTGKYKIKIEKKYENLNLDTLHLSLDTEDDYKILNCIFDNVYLNNTNFSIHDVLDYLNDNHDILKYNETIDVFHGKGQELYKEAKKIIPGGTQILSKRPEMFLPDLWPAYYQKAYGINIVTLDGIKMKDFSYMGVGACILGYKDEEVNREVHESVDRGNMSTLNCPAEVELTKLLIEIHPWAEMARYTRASGEACNMAVRIARAASKKDKIAFCGYHGWHDWYLGSNWNNGDDLKEHLLSGLSATGVPKELKNTAFPFNYNNLDELIKIIENNDIGCVVMEPQRSEPPKDGFLHKVRELCDKHNIILIFDEVSASFRINTGGLHLLYGVNPDMAILGKSLGNGYPIAAVIGKKKYMSAAEETFISSTFFSEDIGFTAAIATIKKHRDCDVGNHIKVLGSYFQTELKKIGENIGIKITVSGLEAFSAWTFDYPNATEIKTLYIQKMLQRHILAKNAFYLSYAHKKEDVDYYLKHINEVFHELYDLIEKNEIEKHLLGPVAHTGFKRLA